MPRKKKSSSTNQRKITTMLARKIDWTPSASTVDKKVKAKEAAGEYTNKAISLEEFKRISNVSELAKEYLQVKFNKKYHSDTNLNAIIEYLYEKYLIPINRRKRPLNKIIIKSDIPTEDCPTVSVTVAGGKRGIGFGGDDFDSIDHQPSTSKKALAGLSKEQPSADKQITPSFLKPLGKYMDFEPALPVTLEIFRASTNWAPIVDSIADKICRNDDYKNLKSDPKFIEQLLENVYLNFYLDPAFRDTYSLSMKACPKFLKEKILSEAEISWLPNRQQGRDFFIENNSDRRFDEKNKSSDKPLEILKKRHELAESYRDVACDDEELSDEGNPEEQGVSHRPSDSQKSGLEQQHVKAHTRVFQKGHVKRLLDEKIDDEEGVQAKAVPVGNVHIESVEIFNIQPSANNAEKENEAESGASVMETDQTTEAAVAVDTLQDVKAEFFKIYEKDRTLPYLLFTSDFEKQRIICSIMKMTIEEFVKWTRIYRGDEIYQDPELLKQCYRFAIVDKGIWPTNLFIPLVDFIEFLRCQNIVLDSFELNSLSPKFLHWSDLIAFTNFDECVRRYFLNLTPTPLFEEDSLQARRVAYYHRCWNADSWLGQSLQLTDEGLQKQLQLNRSVEYDNGENQLADDILTLLGYNDNNNAVIDLTSEGLDVENETIDIISTQESTTTTSDVSMLNPADPVERALYELFSDGRKTQTSPEPSASPVPNHSITKSPLHEETCREVVPRPRMQLSPNLFSSSGSSGQPSHGTGNTVTQESTQTSGASNATTVSGLDNFVEVANTQTQIETLQSEDETNPRDPLAPEVASDDENVTTAITATLPNVVKTEPKLLKNVCITLNDDGDIVASETLSEDIIDVDDSHTPEWMNNFFMESETLTGSLPTNSMAATSQSDSPTLGQRLSSIIELLTSMKTSTAAQEPPTNKKNSGREPTRRRLTEDYVPQMRHQFRPLPVTVTSRPTGGMDKATADRPADRSELREKR